MGIEWFYQVAGETRGPVSARELRALADAETVTAETLVRLGRDGRWVPARKVKRLCERLGTQPAPPPPVPARKPPPLPPRVCGPVGDGPATVAGGPRARRGWGMSPIRWMLVTIGAVAAVVVVAASVSFFGGRDSGPADRPKGRFEILGPIEWPIPAPQKNLSAADVYERVAPAVVLVRSLKAGELQAVGSGFVAEGDVIVTNEHVIHGASRLEIKTHAGKTAAVTGVLAVDQDKDVAVLPVPDSLRGTPTLRLALRAPRVGDSVYAIGAPLGLESTFTAGVVSQIRRQFLKFGLVIQHDASIAAGSSGGPLLNAAGAVVGVNTFARVPEVGAQNLNFAVPSSTVIAVARIRRYQELTQLPGYNESASPADALAEFKKWLAEYKAEQAREKAAEIKEAKGHEGIQRELEKARESNAKESKRFRVNERIVNIRRELRTVDSEGASLTEKHSQVLAAGKAAFVRLA